LKAVIGMDVKNSEVGTSHGRSGKSMIGWMVEQIVPTVIIDAKNKKLTEDQFMLEEVEQSTGVIVFDDCRSSIDFEHFFSLITGRATINRKGQGKFKLDSDHPLKLYFSTNHAMSGEGASFTDRQLLVGFSDYFSDSRKPVDVFGNLFFVEWDSEQWNLFYNCMAQCLQFYLQHGLIESPAERLEMRRLRQEIGDDFLSWAESFFSDPVNINVTYDRKELTGKIEVDVKGAMRWRTTTIKKKLQLFCKYAGLI